MLYTLQPPLHETFKLNTAFVKIFIKYMVSIRCKMVVKEELRKLGLHFILVDLGEVEHLLHNYV